MVCIIYGGQLVNLCLLSKDLLNFEPLIENAGYVSAFLQRIADLLSVKWEMDYGLVMGWIRTRLSCAILCATLLCIRGCHTKWRSLGLVDGASIAL